jgi:hypothetical protein
MKTRRGLACELPIERRALLHGAVAGELLDQARQTEAAHREVGPAGRVSERPATPAMPRISKRFAEVVASWPEKRLTTYW